MIVQTPLLLVCFSFHPRVFPPKPSTLRPRIYVVTGRLCRQDALIGMSLAASFVTSAKTAADLAAGLFTTSKAQLGLGLCTLDFILVSTRVTRGSGEIRREDVQVAE